MFSIMDGYFGLHKSHFSPTLSMRTRGHRLKFAKKRAVSRVRRNHFSTPVVSDWNALPEDVVCSPSLNTIKNLLDKHWRQMYDPSALQVASTGDTLCLLDEPAFTRWEVWVPRARGERAWFTKRGRSCPLLGAPVRG